MADFPQRSAVIQMPTTGQMGGQVPGRPAFIRAPFFPTAPFLSTDPNVGYQTRWYTQNFSSTDPAYNINSEKILRFQFDIPVRLCAMNGASVDNTGVLDYAGYGLNNFLFRAEYTNGDKLVTEAVLASTILGTAQRPGELGGVGWTMQPGSTLIVGITPLRDDLFISVALQCLEMRAATNYTGPI